MRIDVHAHYWTDDYLDLMVGLGKTDTAAQRSIGAGEHAIETLREFSYAKAIRYPSGIGSIPSWRGVTDIFGEAGSFVSL